MPLSLDDMASKGYTKGTAKADSMRKSWEAARSRMKTGYGAQPFGPTRKSNYNTMVDKASYRTDWDKWKTNWKAKMAE